MDTSKLVGHLATITIRRVRIGHEAGPGWLNFFIDGTPHRLLADGPGVTIEPVSDEVEIPVEAAAHTLFLFARGGWPASGFKSALLHAIAQADILNRNRLALAYPEYVAAYNLAQNDDDGIAKLQAIVARDGA